MRNMIDWSGKANTGDPWPARSLTFAERASTWIPTSSSAWLVPTLTAIASDDEGFDHYQDQGILLFVPL
jgi:hypothetical protein